MVQEQRDIFHSRTTYRKTAENKQEAASEATLITERT